MRAIVTGGAGFIGSYLCESLLARGLEVTCVDNLSTGRKQNIEHLLERPDFRFVLHDVTQPLEAEADLICHLASPASPSQFSSRSFLRLPVETALVNSVGTYYLLELARRSGARMLLASTSEVYGDPLQHPQKEEYWGNVNPTGPRSCYDESKRFSETLAVTYQRRYGTDVRIARIFNTYGPRMDPEDGRVVPNFIVQALAGLPITVYGDGSQTRSFCYVEDLVRGIDALLFSPDASGQVVNLGNPEERSVMELAGLTKALCGSSSSFTHKPLPEGDPARRCPEISKARALLGWAPTVSLEKGLARTIEWFRGVLPHCAGPK